MAFLTSKSATEKITNLETRLSELAADANSREDHISGLEKTISGLEKTITERAATISAHTATVSGLNGQIETLTAERDKATATHTAAQASLTEANGKLEGFDAKVESAALAKFQSLGGDPIPASGKNDETPANVTELSGLARAIAAHKAKKAAK